LELSCRQYQQTSSYKNEDCWIFPLMVIFIGFFLLQTSKSAIHRFCLPMTFRFRKHKGHDLTYDVKIMMWFFPRKYKYRCIRVYAWFKDDKLNMSSECEYDWYWKISACSTEYEVWPDSSWYKLQKAIHLMFWDVYVIWMWIDWYRKYQPAEPEYEVWWQVSEANKSQTS
jgi:hypothetical protein